MSFRFFFDWSSIPFWILLFASDTGAQLALKVGSGSIAHTSFGLPWLAGAAASPLIWIGLACYLCSFALWMRILRTTPLSLAFSLSGMSYVSVLVMSFALLGEQVTPLRWLGVCVIVAGVTLVAREEGE